MSHEARNTDCLRKLYALWNQTKAGGVDHWMSLLAEAVNFGSLAQGRPDSLSFTRMRRSREEVRRYFDELTRDWAMIDYVIDHYVAQGDRVVAIGRMTWRNKNTSRIVDSPKVDVWRFNDAGEAIEFFEYYDTAAAIAAAH